MWRHCKRCAAPGLAILSLAVAGCSVSPTPVPPRDVNRIISEDRKIIQAAQEPITRAITLHEALARAVAYNLDHRTRLMEEALARGQYDLARFDMMPALTAEGSIIARDNQNASSSRNVRTLQQSLEPSTSVDRTRRIADLRGSWNILDFGVGYYQAKQASDRYLITQGNRTKLMLRLLQQTRTAYWRAASADKLRARLRRVMGEAQTALDDIDRSIRERLPNPTQALVFKRSLLEIVGQLEALDQALQLNEIELKSLINVGPNSTLELDVPDAFTRLPAIEAKMEDLETLALQNATDMTEQIYSKRIEQAEGRKALLRLLPGVEFGLTGNYDSNSYLVNDMWSEASIRITWNLLRLMSTESVMDLAEARENLADVRRLTVNMAVITRVNLSVRRYSDTLNQVRRAREINDVEQEIARLSQSSQQADAGSQLERIRNEASALRARFRVYETYANAQDALGTVFVSLGLNPVPENYRDIPIDDLTRSIQSATLPWELGLIPPPSAD